MYKRCKALFQVIIISLLLSAQACTAIFAASIDGYINGSSSGSVNSSKIINYFNQKKVSYSGNTYCIGRDKVLYYETFYDSERDYSGLKFSERLKQNSQISEAYKKINPDGLKFKYEHEPGVYDNPVSKSAISGIWYNIAVNWDKDKRKFELYDASGNVLFKEPTDDKRGEWTIYLQGKDTTGKPVFDRESEGIAKFRVHKAPVPLFKFSESGNTATLTDSGSYDIDYQYSKNSKKNAANDREYSGIKEFYWSVKIGGKWVDLGTGASISFNKNGQAVTDYRLTVEDYDGAFESISKTSLIFNSPAVDFDFVAGSTVTPHFYEGNVAHETLKVSPHISYNDEAYDGSIYQTSGIRSLLWTATVGNFKSASTNSFITSILNGKYSEIVSKTPAAPNLPVKLRAKNKYDITAEKEKAANIITIATSDKTGAKDTVVCGECIKALSRNPFMVGTKATLIYNITNAKVQAEDIKIMLDAPDIGISGKEIPLTNNVAETELKLSDPGSYSKAWWDSFGYRFSIYSRRTNELLHQDSGTAYIHTPVTVDGYVNDKKDEIEINADEPFKLTALTNKYAKTVTAQLPYATEYNGAVYPADTPIPLKADNAGHTSWSLDGLKLDGYASDEDVVSSVLFKATAYNNRDTASDTVEVTIISYRLENFRVTMIRDLHLENFYKSGNDYKEFEMNVNYMGIDFKSFLPYAIDYLTKGYKFEFKIDSVNFNADVDTIEITPHFYSIAGSSRSPNEKAGFWIDSDKKVWPIGGGGHSDYEKITLTKDNREIIDTTKATWRGEYFIPGTSFLAPDGTSLANAYDNKIEDDIIVNFEIIGYKNGIPKFNYNIRQWPKERVSIKAPYDIGDVIRYNGKHSNLDDLKVYRVRP